MFKVKWELQEQIFIRFGSLKSFLFTSVYIGRFQYIRIDEKPIFVGYKPFDIPDIKENISFGGL